MQTLPDRRRRTLLYLPASNPRALAKARTLASDALILDLEDSVMTEDKDDARSAALAALADGFASGEAGLRLNGADSAWHDADLVAAAASAAAFVVLPKVESAAQVASVSARVGRPVLAMIETPAGILAAPAIAAACAGLIVGTNDLAATLRLPADGERLGLAYALGAIVMAARAAGVPAWDGVYNWLDDPDGLATECAAGRRLGFDGKTLIHPNQIDIANAAFGPDAAELDDARALIAAATGGAERFRGRMIEGMHVDAARRLLRDADV